MFHWSLHRREGRFNPNCLRTAERAGRVAPNGVGAVGK
jgi:hypothetical protein